ncbi:helix-turn-helix domain-containing protein [Rhodococcus koreensis]
MRLGSELGHAEVVFTIPAESVRQATTTALAVLETYEWPAVSLRVLTTADFDRLTDAVDLPPLVSVQEAADGARDDRQGVLKAIKSKVLPATRVGGTWVLQRSVVEAARARRGAQT